MSTITVTKTSEDAASKNLRVTIPVDRVEEATSKAVRQYAKRARLPGFRQGKAPEAVVRRRFSNEIRQWVIEEVIREGWEEAKTAESLKPITDPSIRNLKFEEGSPIEFDLLVEVRPEIKLDFVSYHHYGKDSGPNSDAGGFFNFKKSLMNLIVSKNFTGDVINDEWGPGYDPELSRDTEASASFIAKSVHFIGTDTTTRMPTMYGYWTLSDIYEEMNTGAARAYREGNYGLLLKGDANIPASADLAKPAFNAFRLLHMMTDKIVPVTGGIAAATDNGVGAVATLSDDGSSLQILVYNHVNNFDNTTWEAMSQESTLVSLSVNDLPFVPTRVLHYIVDHTHSNSHTVWASPSMGKPLMPTAEQWDTLRDASELCYYATPGGGSNSWTVMFPQNTYSASLIELRRE